MSERDELKSSGIWKWILGVGAGCLIVAALVVYGLASYLFIKGKPQLAEALDQVVQLESDKLPAAEAALLREMDGLASQKDASLAAVTLMANSVSGAVADHQISAEEHKQLALIRDFVQAGGGRVSYKELGAFNGDHPEIMKLQESQNLAAQVIEWQAAQSGRKPHGGEAATSQPQTR